MNDGNLSWKIGVCPICDRIGPVYGKCGGPENAEHPWVMWETVEVVPRHPFIQAEKKEAA